MSIYHFMKNDSQPSPSKRLFVQGARSAGAPSRESSPLPEDTLEAVYTKKKLSTEVLGSSFESTKTTKMGQDGRRRITTKIVRKVTTLARGEEQKRAEGLLKKGEAKRVEAATEVARNVGAIEPKRVKVRI